MFLRRTGVLILVVLGLFLCVGSGAWVYNLTIVQDTVGWRISQLRADIKYAMSPPEEAVFTPDPTIAAIVESTLMAITPSPTTTLTPGLTLTPTPSPTTTLVPTTIPASIQLSGIKHEYQKWNNCGPANLSMALSYWGWDGDQRPVAEFVKPNPRDKNVMPYEMAAFVNEGTSLSALVRAGGNIDLLKKFIAAGFPVMVEKGFEGPGFDGWMGHYEVLSGYDDGKQTFSAQDSYIMPNLPVSYEDIETYWRHFNYTYLVLYPPDRENEVLKILGPDADETYNIENAAQIASDEIFQLNGRAQLFAWFNRGTNLMQLQDYAGASAAYDEAFKIDAEMAFNDPDHRPWRMMWYQTGPYWAYFYSGRYYDVLNLADFTINNSSEPAFEESFYWRGMAKEVLGDTSGAITDYRSALKWHPDWEPALLKLAELGASP